MSIAIFPLSMSEMSGGPRFQTDITVGGNGREVRNAVWQDPLWTWNAAYAVKTRADAYTLYTHFLNCYGRETTFLMYDPFDYRISQDGSTFQTIGTGDGSDLTFQITKTYTDDYSNTFTRNIYRPSATTSDLVVKVNGTTKTHTTHYTYSTTTGVITFTGGNAPPNGHAVTITLQKFYTLVRFDIDELPMKSLLAYVASGADYSLHEVPDIPLIEVRES